MADVPSRCVVAVVLPWLEMIAESVTPHLAAGCQSANGQARRIRGLLCPRIEVRLRGVDGAGLRHHACRD